MSYFLALLPFPDVIFEFHPLYHQIILKTLLHCYYRTACLLKHVLHGYREQRVCQPLCAGVCARPRALLWLSFHVSWWRHSLITPLRWSDHNNPQAEKLTVPPSPSCYLHFNCHHLPPGCGWVSACAVTDQGRHGALAGEENHLCVLWIDSWTWCRGGSKTPKVKRRVKQLVEKENKSVCETQNLREKEGLGEANDQMRSETSGLRLWSGDREVSLTGTRTVTCCLFSSFPGICVGAHQAVQPV